MTEGSIGKKVLKFSVPLILSNILQILFNMADVAVVGRFAGSEALGSVGSTSIMIILFIDFLIGLSGGINALCARFFGAKDDQALSETVHTAFIVCMIGGLIILLSGQLFTRPLLELLRTKDELIGGAETYFRIYLLGMPALAIYNFGNAVLSAVGDTKKPLLYLSIAGALNVALNLFFVIVCNMGVAGVALASAISQYVSGIMIVAALFRANGAYGLRLNRIRITKSKNILILKLGIPAGIQHAVFQIANLFIQAGVNSFSAVVVEGNSAAANTDGLVYDVMLAFYTACSSFIGQNLGAGKKDRIRRSFYWSLFYSFAAGALLGSLLVFAGKPFLMLFTNDPAVAEAGMLRLTVMGFSYGVSAFMDCTIAASRGLGKTGWPTFFVIMGSVVFRIIWIFTVFRMFHTMTVLYLVYVCSWVITAIPELIYFSHTYRKLSISGK